MTLVHGVRTIAIILAAAAACAMVPRAFAQATQPDAAASAQHDLELRSATLNSSPDAATDSHDREEAAQRLVSRQSPEARAILLRALTSNNPAAQLAVARAVAEDRQPDPALVDPLINALHTSPTGPAARYLPAAAARALVTYNNPDTLRRLIAMVQKLPREPESLRRDIIDALGFSNEKLVAQALVTVLRTADETETIRKAAADALTEMSGISDYGQDSQRWTEWFASNNQKSDADFRNEILARRAIDNEQSRQRLAELTEALYDLLNKNYHATPPDQQVDFLLTNLRSSIPAFRAQTARIVEDDLAIESKRPADLVRVQLRTMIGDSDPKVRIAVAHALATINDDGALQPLLAQVAQEKDGLVRAQQARALGLINKLDAVPALIEMIKNDPSVVAATAAARAIGGEPGSQSGLGERMVKDKSPLVGPAAQALREAFDRQRPGGNSDFREALIEAMASLKQSDLADTFYRILKSDESAQIRRLAIKALGEIGDPKSAAVIVDAMHDVDAHVRVDAVTALGKLPNADKNIAALRQHAGPEEQDPSVREAAWKVIQNLLPLLDTEEIANIILLYKNNDNDPIRAKKELLAQKTQEDKLIKQNNLVDLPILQENIGQTLLILNDYQGAAEYYKKALDIQKAQNAQFAIIGLREERMKALLQGKLYDEAAVFASESIHEDDSAQLKMGSLITQQVLQLQANKNYDDAMKLIGIALDKIDPPLSPTHLARLREMQAEITRNSGKTGPTSTTKPAP